MQNSAKERRCQKQNDLSPSYQRKARRYDDLTGSSQNNMRQDENGYSPKLTAKTQNSDLTDYNDSAPMDRIDDNSFKKRYNLQENSSDQASFGTYNQSTNYSKHQMRTIPQNNQQVDYRKYLKDNNQKSPSPLKKVFTQNNLGQYGKIVDFTHSQTFKKENAKNKGLQMKMTNIESISDQINSLLSMVNKSKRAKDGSSISANKFAQKQPSRNHEDSLQKYKGKKNNSPVKNTPFQPSNRELNKHKRGRVYSDLNNEFREQFDSIKCQSKKKYAVCNQQENINRKYSQKSYLGNQKYLQDKSLETKASRNEKQPTGYSYHHKQSYHKQPQKSSSPYRNYTHKQQKAECYEYPSKYSGQTFEQKEDTKYAEYTPKYSKNKQKANRKQNHLRPYQIKNESWDNRTVSFQRSNTAIQQPTRKSKSKVPAVEQRNYRYSQKLQDQQPDINCHEKKSAGRFYRRNDHKSQFSLKLYPVPIDTPNILRVAEKLAEQIEADKKIALPTVHFLKQQSQQKWDQIELYLKDRQPKMTKFKIQKLLELSQEQVSFNNYQIKSNYNCKNIAELLFQAQKHWEHQVYGCVSLKALKSQNFSAQSLNLYRDQISLSDLTNFVKTYAGRQYQSDDLRMIYRRLQLLEGSQNSENVEFNTFVKAIAI